MEKICRELSLNFLSELNNKVNFCEINDFFNYSKSLYEDLLIIDKHYKEQFNTHSLLSIKRYLILFNNTFNKIIEYIFDKNFVELIKNEKSKYLQNCGRFNIKEIIAYQNKTDNKTNFLYKFFNKKDFEVINSLANKIFTLEAKCSKITKKFWKTNTSLNLKDGLFVKIITEKKWREEKTSLQHKSYYNSRVGLSVSFVNEQKSKFFRDNKLDVLAGIIYTPKKIICGNYFDCFTEEYINNCNPLKKPTFSFSGVNKVYSEKINGKKHDIFAYATLTATPQSVLSCDDYHNEVIVDKKSAKPVAIFYLNENSVEYAKKLAQKYKLPIIKLDSFNNLNKNNVTITQNIIF